MSSDQPRRSVRDQLHGGGTAVGGDGFPWLLVAIGGAAALAAVVWWLVGDGDDPLKRPSAAAATPDSSEAAPGPPGAGPSEVEPPSPPAAATADEASDDRRAAAAAGLERALGADQLWGTVEGDGDAVVIRSAYCADAGLAARLAAATPELRGAGFHRVVCVEQHGATAFERGL